MATNHSKIGDGRRPLKRQREYVRYFCSNDGCDSRVYPYDGFEAATHSPIEGIKGQPILLYSLNAKRSSKNEEHRTAWCFRCDQWTNAKREGRMEIMLRYLRRRGVEFRLKADSETGLAKALNRRMEQRKGVGVISMSNKR